MVLTGDNVCPGPLLTHLGVGLKLHSIYNTAIIIRMKEELSEAWNLITVEGINYEISWMPSTM